MICMINPVNSVNPVILSKGLFVTRSGFGFLPVLLCQDARRCHRRYRRHHLVLEPAHHITFAIHHRVETDLRHINRIVLFLLSDLRVFHSRTLENSVSVAPGIRHVTVTPLSFSSARNANENESMKALLAL